MRILLILVILLGLAGCRKGDASETLSTDKRILRYDFILTRDTVTVTCGLPVGWQARSTQEWIAVNKLDNKRLEIVAQTNDGNDERNGYVEISAGGMGITLLVFQGYDPSGMPLQAADSLALVALYKTTGGEKWRFKGDDEPASIDTRWDFKKPMRTWSGVECYREEGQHRVRKLDITSRGAVGPLPPQIVNLTALKSFIANNNKLDVSSLQLLSKLTELRTLNLGLNHFGGSISDLPLAAWRNMEVLDLEGNNLAGELPDFTEFHALKELVLTNNKLTGGLNSLRSLQNIEVLNLSVNQFRDAFPAWIGDLNKLTLLSLSDNALEGAIPTGIGQLEALTTLDLSRCGLTGEVPAEMGNLRKLKSLDLSFNALTTVPSGAITSPQLEILDLRHNKLTSVSNDLGSLTSLKSIYLSNNNLTRIEGSWEGMRSLERMDLSDNQLTALPIGTMTLTTLISLIAENNQLAVLPSIFALKNLRIVVLANNVMKGQVPEWIADLSLLQALDLSNNYLIGPVPEAVTRCPDIFTLRLSGNNLSGVVPPAVRSDKRWNGDWKAATNICPQRTGYTLINCGHSH